MNSTMFASQMLFCQDVIEILNLKFSLMVVNIAILSALLVTFLYNCACAAHLIELTEACNLITPWLIC